METNFDKIVYETQRKLFEGEDVSFVSSVYIQPRMREVQNVSEIEIRQQPRKKVVYKTGVVLMVSLFDIDGNMQSPCNLFGDPVLTKISIDVLL